MFYVPIHFTYPNIQNKNINKKETFIKIERSPCFGTCPFYTLTLKRDGEMFLDGKQHIPLIGLFTKKLSKIKTDSIFNVFKKEGFYKLKNEYISQMTDFPTTTISYVVNDKIKKVKAYGPAPSLIGYVAEMMHLLITDTLYWEKKTNE